MDDVFDVDADVKEALSSPLNFMEAVGIGIYLYISAHQIMELYNHMIFEVTKGSKKILDKRALYALLSGFSHYMLPFVNAVLNGGLFSFVVLKNMNEEILKNNADFIENLNEKLILLYKQLIHYHKVGNELKRIDEAPLCECQYHLFEKEYELLSKQDWWQALQEKKVMH